MKIIQPTKKCNHDPGKCGCGSFPKYAKPLIKNVKNWNFEEYEDNIEHTHCICGQRISIPFTIRHKTKKKIAIIGSDCVKYFTDGKVVPEPYTKKHVKFIDILKKNNKLNFKSLMINKSKKLCRELYNKSFLKNKKKYYPILQYVCGEIKIEKMKLRIWKNIYGEDMYQEIKNNSAKLYSKYNKLKKKEKEALQDFLDFDLYIFGHNFIHKKTEFKKLCFLDLKTIRDICEKNPVFKGFYNYYK